MCKGDEKDVLWFVLIFLSLSTSGLGCQVGYSVLRSTGLSLKKDL